MDGQPMYRFRLIDAAYIIGSVITFLADQTTGKYKSFYDKKLVN